MKMGKYIEKNTSVLNNENLGPESEKSEVEMMTFEKLEKELKSVNLILNNSSDQDLKQYKNELVSEIEKRKLTTSENTEIGISKYFSELLQENFIVNSERRIVRFVKGEKYSFDEIERMKRNNYQPKDVKLLHCFKSKFGVRYVETEKRFQEGLFA